MTPQNTTALAIFIPNEERRRIQATHNHYERTRRETAASSLSSKILRFMNEDVKLLRYLLQRPTFCTYYSPVFWGQTHDNGESTNLCHSPQYRGIARSHDCVPVMHRVMLIRVGKTHFLPERINVNHGGMWLGGDNDHNWPGPGTFISPSEHAFPGPSVPPRQSMSSTLRVRTHAL